MSLAKMARIAAAPAMRVKVSAGPSEAESPQAPAEPTLDQTKSPINSQLTEIAAFIPSEALALYIALLGLLVGTSAERDYGVKWGLFALGLVIVLFAIVDGYMTSRRAHKDGTVDDAPRPQRFAWIALFAVISFTIYAMAMPDSPFEQLADETGLDLSLIAGGLALVASFMIPRIAAWVNVSASDAEPAVVV